MRLLLYSHICSSACDASAVTDDFTHLAIDNTLQVQLRTLISGAVHKWLWVAEITTGWTKKLKEHIDWLSD